MTKSLGFLFATLVLLPPLAHAWGEVGVHPLVANQPLVQQTQFCNPDGLTRVPPGAATLASLSTFRDAMTSQGYSAYPTRDASDMICQALTVASSIAVVHKSQGGFDGELTLHVVWPYLDMKQRAPVPYHDLNDPQGVVGSAGDLANVQDPERWNPLVFNLNDLLRPQVPCTAQALDITSVAGNPLPCGDVPFPCECKGIGVGVNAVPLVAGLSTPAVQAASFEHAQSPAVELLYRVEVDGFLETGQRVFHQALESVVTAHGAATERLTNVQGEVFRVQVYVTAADAAIGNAIESVPVVVPSVPLDVHVVTMTDLPLDGRGQIVDSTSLVKGEVHVVNGWNCASYNQCYAKIVKLREHGAFWKSEGSNRHSYSTVAYQNNTQGNGTLLTSMDLDPADGIRTPLTVLTLANMGRFTVAEGGDYWVVPLWYLSGEIVQRCHGDRGCAAQGASASGWYTLGKYPDPTGPRPRELLINKEFWHSASPVMNWCDDIPGLPKKIAAWWELASRVLCWSAHKDWDDNRKQLMREVPIYDPAGIQRVRLDSGSVYDLSTTFRAEVCCVTTGNLPQINDMEAAFEGFLFLKQ